MVTLNRLNDINYLNAKIKALQGLNKAYDSQYHARALEYGLLINALNNLHN